MPHDVSTDRALALELTAVSLEQVAPDELPVLDESAEEYFEDPDAALSTTDGDAPLGSGVTVVMMTPYLLAAAGTVLPVLGAIAADLGKDVAKDLVKEPVVDWLRRLIRRPGQAPPADALTAAQLARVRGVVEEKARACGLADAQAALVADATAGALHAAP